MIFVTVGSFGPFDRMVKAVDHLAAEHPHRSWFAQIGKGSYLPQHMEYERYLDKRDFDSRIRSADVLIGHAGVGTITAAIRYSKPLIVMPRDHDRGEHVDDHQFATADLFEAGGHILVARDSRELRLVWQLAPTFHPAPRESTAAAVGDRVGKFLRGI
jgi:UDP-N-acetylglucosamine transferase subunit ALG13